jgi:hypothetical protein
VSLLLGTTENTVKYMHPNFRSTAMHFSEVSTKERAKKSMKWKTMNAISSASGHQFVVHETLYVECTVLVHCQVIGLIQDFEGEKAFFGQKKFIQIAKKNLLHDNPRNNRCNHG